MILIKQGETYIKRLELKTVDTRQPIDLTGYTAYSQMRDRPGGTLAAQGSCSITASTGVILVTYSSGQTSAIEPGEYGFDIWIKSGNEKHPLYTSRVKVVKSYTENM